MGLGSMARRTARWFWRLKLWSHQGNSIRISNLRFQISEVLAKQKMNSSLTQADAIAAVEQSWLPRRKPNHVIDYRAVYGAQVFDRESFTFAANATMTTRNL